MTYFSMSINILHNMADTVERTLDDFSKLLKTIFEEDDDPKVISSDNESNLDSYSVARNLKRRIEVNDRT